MKLFVQLFLPIVLDIKALKTKTQTIEIKGCPTRLFDTLSSFSNQDECGITFFDVEESDNYAIKGVYDAQDLQKKVTEQCKQMDPSVHALFTVCEIDNKAVVSAEIPGVDISEHPVFYKGVGHIKGSYVRVGESDIPISEYEILKLMGITQDDVLMLAGIMTFSKYPPSLFPIALYHYYFTSRS